MSSGLELLLPEPPPQVPNFVWATLMLKSPARVRIDGETAVIAVQRDALVDFDSAEIGDRVLLVRQRSRLIAIGIGGGTAVPQSATLSEVLAQIDTDTFVSPFTLGGWSEKNVGSHPALPASIEVTSGTATANESGLITFSNTPAINLNQIFEPGVPGAYAMVIGFVSPTAQTIWMRGRHQGTTYTTVYNRLCNSIQYGSGPIRVATFGAPAGGYIKPANGGANDGGSAEVIFVKTASTTHILMRSWTSESGDRRFWEEQGDFSGSYDGLTIAGGGNNPISGWLQMRKIA